MRISFITTVLNEEKNIDLLLLSLLQQTKLPDEIIITDGGSIDKTVENIKKYIPLFKEKKIPFHLLLRPSNISVGRNEAIRNSHGSIIVSSDAGCILDKEWIENIIKPFANPKIDVVAGYYRGIADSVFQKSLIPYVLVMEDKTNINFLPSSRSMSFRKKIWQKAGGFPQQYDYSEDYIFAKNLQKIGAKIVFKQDAIVNWIPRNSIKEAFIMFLRFAYFDAKANVIRQKVYLIYLRYIFSLLLLILVIISQQMIIFILLLFIFVLYIVWAINKNYQYVKHTYAFFYLPLLQLMSDAAVLIGTTQGFITRIWDIQKMH